MFYKSKLRVPALLLIWLPIFTACTNKKPALVFQSDFGLKDGAVSAMKGVCIAVDPGLALFDLTHEIPSYNIWEAAYRLQQTAPYWPAGTVFVSVVDPGVGTDRRSVVLKTKSGHFFVSPDNGTLTLIAESLGIEEIRSIDEELNRRKNSHGSYTFHGRDVYGFTAARLASGVINFKQVGARLEDTVVKLKYQPSLMRGDSIFGNIPILDIQYGNVWTNIPDSLFRKLNANPGDIIEASIFNSNSRVFLGTMAYAETFGAVPEQTPLCYLNSLMNISLALNMGSFTDSFKVGSGPHWSVVIRKK